MHALTLKPGDAFEGGMFAGLTTTREGVHCAVVLLADKPPVTMPWQQAMDWAAGLNATLPTRPVAALLYANLGPQFEQEWHWTCETDKDDGSYAWLQFFFNGFQLSSHKSWKGRAIAVRLIQLTA